MKTKILVIAAHPDDETLGCGGLISKRTFDGVCAKAIFISDGVSSRYPENDRSSWKSELEIRKNSARNASAILGMEEPTFFDFPDNKLDSIPLLTLAKMVEEHVKEFQPSTILTHFPGDLNVDHSITSQVALIASRPNTFYKPNEILFFEIASSTENSLLGFHPNYYVDITNHVSNKLLALQEYQFELRNYPNSRSREGVENLAKFRGNCVSVAHAEAFISHRIIV